MEVPVTTWGAELIGSREPVVLAVDNGGTNTRIARGSENIDRIEAYPTPQSYDQAVGQIAATARVVLNGRRPDAVGFSVAGKVEEGRIVSAGQLQEYRWTGRPFAADVAEELGVSPDRVILLNDCAAGANAERTVRQPKGGEAGAFMVLSTGFGAALYTRGELIADEPGHHYLKPGAICGDGEEGHMEAHISGSGMERKFGLPDERTGGHPFLLNDDPRWKEVRSDFHESMARTLARWKSEYGFDGLALRTIGFTGSVALRGPDLLGGLQRDLGARMAFMTPTVEEAVYRDESGLYGAAFAASDMLHAA